MNSRLMTYAFVSTALVLLGGCASHTTPQTEAVALAGPPANDPCSSGQNGLASPPTPETRAAMVAFDAATKLSIADLQEAMGRGDAAAQIELGLRYANGKDVPTDYARALTLFEAAAKQDNPLGYYFIGTAFSNGSGVPKDDSRAVYYWEYAARKGYPLAQYWLALFIGNGRGGISKNWCAAVPLLATAGMEDAEAALALGLVYHQGEVVGDYPDRPDYKRAAYWFRKSNQLKRNPKAQFNLRILIESYLVDWQPGDPGKPPKPLPPGEKAPTAPRPIFGDPSRESTG